MRPIRKLPIATVHSGAGLDPGVFALVPTCYGTASRGVGCTSWYLKFLLALTFFKCRLNFFFFFELLDMRIKKQSDLGRFSQEKFSEEVNSKAGCHTILERMIC